MPFTSTYLDLLTCLSSPNGAQRAAAGSILRASVAFRLAQHSPPLVIREWHPSLPCWQWRHPCA